MPRNDSGSTHAILNIDQHVKDSVIGVIDGITFFDGLLAKDRMLLAFALGVKNGMKVPLVTRVSGGYARKEYLKPRDEVLIRAVQLAEGNCENTEALCDFPSALDMFEEYANGGFKILEAELAPSLDSEELANRFVQEMDSMYEKFTGKALEV